MKISIIITSVLLGLLFSSCENLSDPGEIDINKCVNVNLINRDANQQIKIYKTLPINFEFHSPTPWLNPDEAFETNAKVTISGENFVCNNFRIDTNKLNLHRFYTNSEKIVIESNKEYIVQIASNNQLAEGKIKTIGDFNINEVKKINEDDKGNANFRISWDKCDGARYYNFSVTYYFYDSVIVGRNNGNLVYEYRNISVSRSEYIGLDSLIEAGSYSREITAGSKIDSVYIEIGAYDINNYNYQFKRSGK